MTAANVGEWSTEAPVTEEVKDMCIKMKSDIEKKAGVESGIKEKAGVPFDVFIPKTYRSEPRCGGHYLVKVKVGVDDKYVVAMLCDARHGGKVTADTCLTVKGVQFLKSASHPLEPFGTLAACGK